MFHNTTHRQSVYRSPSLLHLEHTLVAQLYVDIMLFKYNRAFVYIRLVGLQYTELAIKTDNATVDNMKYHCFLTG